MIMEIAFLALCILLLVVMPIAFTYCCWRFWYDARWWLVVGATGAHSSIFKLIKADGDPAYYLLHVASVIFGLILSYISWKNLTSRLLQPARSDNLTRLAKLYGIKRRWRGFEPDYLLRRRCLAAINGAMKGARP